MGDAVGRVLKWLYTAPLPAVIALLIVLACWVVYTQDSLHAQQQTQAAETKAMKAEDARLLTTVEKINEKLDKLLEAVLEYKAQQKALQERLDRAQARRDARDDARDARSDGQTKEGQKP